MSNELLLQKRQELPISHNWHINDEGICRCLNCQAIVGHFGQEAADKRECCPTKNVQFVLKVVRKEAM